MSYGLYMDVHVPRPVTDALRARDINVLTAQEDGMDEAEDAALLDRALALNRFLVTRDKDFLFEVNRRLATQEAFATVIYAHQLRVGVGRFIDELELIALAATESDARNSLMYLPLRPNTGTIAESG